MQNTQDITCSVCLEQYSSVHVPTTIFPCGHSLCMLCADRVTTCPVDRQQIDGRAPNWAVIQLLGIEVTAASLAIEKTRRQRAEHQDLEDVDSDDDVLITHIRHQQSERQRRDENQQLEAVLEVSRIQHQRTLREIEADQQAVRTEQQRREIFSAQRNQRTLQAHEHSFRSQQQRREISSAQRAVHNAEGRYAAQIDEQLDEDSRRVHAAISVVNQAPLFANISDVPRFSDISARVLELLDEYHQARSAYIACRDSNVYDRNAAKTRCGFLVNQIEQCAQTARIAINIATSNARRATEQRETAARQRLREAARASARRARATPYFRGTVADLQR